MAVYEYKCPNCGSGLHFDEESQKLKCPSCDNSFDVQTMENLQQEPDRKEYQWEEPSDASWQQEEMEHIRLFTCPSCGGELIADENTAATFCPYCENPAILPGRVSQGLRPNGVIPFRTSKEDARAAYLNFCKKKPLLPKLFTEESRVEKITGMYVPYWLYDCSCQAQRRYKATRVHHWSDSRYHYTKTEHFLLHRQGNMDFVGIPMDASAKMDDLLMESLEPFDFSALQDFHTGYLSGFYADKYDVPAQEGHERIQERMERTLDGALGATCIGYSSLIPIASSVSLEHGRSRYVLLPVWMLHTKYKDKTYVFAMNGQTGSISGTLPVCSKQSWKWFGIIAGAVAAASFLIQILANL